MNIDYYSVVKIVKFIYYCHLPVIMKQTIFILAVLLILTGCEGQIPTGLSMYNADLVLGADVPVLKNVILDSDNDGVQDDKDICDETPLSEYVNEDGCSCSQVVMDDDNICTQDVCERGIVYHMPIIKQDIAFVECPTDKCENDKWVDFADNGFDRCENGILISHECSVISKNYDHSCWTLMVRPEGWEHPQVTGGSPSRDDAKIETVVAEVPEFTTIGAALALLGALAITKRKK